MSTENVRYDRAFHPLPAEIAQEIINGDLKGLSPEGRVAWVLNVCDSLGISAATRPLQFITLSGRLTLYATKDCTDQLRRRDDISTTIVDRRLDQDFGLYIVTARAMTPSGRSEESIGAVALAGLKDEPLANAIMKAETKAKRRVTLSICGLGFLDESEVADIPGAEVPEISRRTGLAEGGSNSTEKPAHGLAPSDQAEGNELHTVRRDEPPVTSGRIAQLQLQIDGLSLADQDSLRAICKSLKMPNIDSAAFTVRDAALLQRLIDDPWPDEDDEPGDDPNWPNMTWPFTDDE